MDEDFRGIVVEIGEELRDPIGERGTVAKKDIAEIRKNFLSRLVV